MTSDYCKRTREPAGSEFSVHETPPYTRKDGTPVSGYTARNPPRKKAKRIAFHAPDTISAALSGGYVGATISASADAGANAKPPSIEVSIGDFNNTVSALLKSGYKSVSFAAESDSTCGPHSYYAVHDFFEAHPCKWLVRAYLAVHKGNQPLVLVAISWVGMPNISLAKAYKKKVDKWGTGNITELSRDTGSYQKIAYNGKHYLSGIDGTAVWNVQVQPIDPIPNALINTIEKLSKQ